MRSLYSMSVIKNYILKMTQYFKAYKILNKYLNSYFLSYKYLKH